MPILLKTIKILPELFFLFFIPGWFTLMVARRKGYLKAFSFGPDCLFPAFLISFSYSSILGLALAQLGIFSVTLLATLGAAYSVVVYAVFRPQFESPFGRRGNRKGKSAALILSVIIMLAGILFLRPVKYIFGGWDPGVYALTALTVERTGSPIVADPVLDKLSADEKEQYGRIHQAGYLEKYPGFRLGEEKTSRLIPQFYHLFSVLLAVAASWSGPAGMFYFTPVIGLFSLLAFYYLLRDLWGRSTALIGVLLLAINMAEIWQARFPTTEILGQFLMFSGLYLLAGYLDRKDSFTAALAGLVLGTALLTHFSMLLMFAPLAVFFYCRWYLRFHREDIVFLIPFLVLALYSLFPHFFLEDPRYLLSSIGNFSFRGISVPVYLCLLLAAVILIIIRLYPLRRRRLISRLVRDRRTRIAAAVSVFLICWYAYFVRPYIGPPSADKANLVELGWLLTFPGLLLGVAGFIFMILKSRRQAVGIFFLFIGIFSGLFLWQQMIHYHYMWAARRFIIIAVPGGLALAAWQIIYISRRKFRGARLVGAAFLLSIVILEIIAGRVIWNHSEYRETVKFTETVAAAIDSPDLVVVAGEFVDKMPATLHLAYGMPVLPFYRSGDPDWPEVFLIARRLQFLQSSGDPRVYLLSDRRPSAAGPYRFRRVGGYPFRDILLERCGTRLPARLDPAARDGNFTVEIFRVERGGGGE